jgi:hypothetical protein
MANYLFPCIYKSLFGIDCPICGFQRAFIFLLKGDIKQSFEMYLPLLPTIFLMALTALYLLNNKIVNRKFLINYSSVVFTIIIVNYFIKLTM